MEKEPKVQFFRSPIELLLAEQILQALCTKHRWLEFWGTQARLIVKETYGWASASPARPAIPPSSSLFQYALQADQREKI